MARRKGRQYTKAFKEEVLAYWTSTGESAEEVASHFGISTWSLYQWRRQHIGRPLGGDGQPVEETAEQELSRLRRENRRLRMQTEILKKTLGIISSASEND